MIGTRPRTIVLAVLRTGSTLKATLTEERKLQVIVTSVVYAQSASIYQNVAKLTSNNYAPSIFGSYPER